MSALLIGAKILGTVEIVRSFSYKLNAGNYESRDFFMSERAECNAEDAEKISQLLHDFCKKQVMASIAAYMKEQRERNPT